MLEPARTLGALIPAFAAFIATLAACGRDAAEATVAMVRDSAGVRIVENTAPAWGSEPAWRLSDRPSLDIGVLDGDPAYQLFQVTGAIRLSDGRIVVANSGTSELRYYAPDGVFERASGREGGGPGEFQSLGTIHRSAGDTAITFDFSGRRVSFFDSSGEFARSFLVEASQGFAFMRERLADGSFVFSTQLFGGQAREGLVRDTATWLHFDASGTLIDTIGRFPEMEMFIESRGSGDNMSIMIRGIPFGRSTSSAARGDRLLIGTGDAFEIHELDAGGQLVSIIRKAHDPVPLTQEDMDHYVRADLDNTREENRDEARRMWENVPFPATLMPYAGFRIDTEGCLWVEVYRDAAARTALQYGRATYAAEWYVFDPEGQWLGVVTTPPGFRPTDIGSDYLLGMWEDEFEVEHVQLYELTRG